MSLLANSKEGVHNPRASAGGGVQFPGGGHQFTTPLDPQQGMGSVSAFRAVGREQMLVASPAVRPATSPLARSPDMGRRARERRDSSDQDTVSPTPSSTASESHGETHHVVLGGHRHNSGGGGRDAFCWPSQTEENRQLLGGTEEEGSSEVEEETEKNIWLITREQLNYYVTQFRTMQPNPRGVIPGTQAKEFFEKSRLPIQELRQIWQLSDVTKDGCLSLEEFLTAMHLVVLRRNDIPLPEELPMCLTPLNLKQGVIDRHNKDLYTGHQVTEPLLDLTEDSIDGGDQGGPDTDLTLSPESQLSSPSRPKPVKFDCTAVSAGSDPSIACPVPLRLSPDSPYLQSSEDEESPTTVRGGNKKREVVYEQLWNSVDEVGVRRLSSTSSSSDQDTEDEALAGLSSSPSLADSSRMCGPGVGGGPVSLPYFSQEQQGRQVAPPAVGGVTNVLGLQKKEGLPPCPPPRPGKTHARSSSLDLNHLAGQRTTTLPSLPSVPPRGSPFQHQRGTSEGSNTTRHEQNMARDTREISAGIHKFKESVALLTRTVSELGQEVSDTLEERVVLEYQLEQLKAIGTHEEDTTGDSQH